MHRFLRLVSALALLYMTGLLRAEDEHDIRGPAPVKGQVIALNSTTIYKDAVRTIKTGDQTINDKFKEVVTREKEISILAVEGSEITRFRTKILKDSSEESRPKGKRTVRETSKNKLDGQIIY